MSWWCQNFTEHALTGFVFFCQESPKKCVCTFVTRHTLKPAIHFYVFIHKWPQSLQTSYIMLYVSLKPQSVSYSINTREQLIRMTFSYTWEAMWKKRRMAEGPRPLVSFSLQQLHLLLPTAQHQRAREGQRTRDRSQGQDVTSNPEPTSQTSKGLWDAPSQL